MPATIQTIHKPTRARALDTSTSYQDISQELVTNGTFTNWSASSVNPNPDNWTVANENADNHINESGGGGAAVYISDNTEDLFISQTNIFEIGKTYRFRLDCTAHTAGNVGLWHGETLASLGEVGSIDHVFTATRTALTINQVGGTVNLTFDNASVKEVESFSNNNHGQIYSGRGLEFDGVSDYLTTGYTWADDTITICAWAKHVADTNSKTIFDTRNAGDAGALLRFGSSENIQFFIDTSDINYSTYTFTGGWVRICAVYDKANQKQTLYVNGVQVAENTSVDMSAIPDSAPTNGCTIGARSFSSADHFYNGMLSDVQAWNVAFTASDALYDYLNPEQLALNNGGTSLTESNLKLWYPMQDGHRGQQSFILDGANTGLGDEALGDPEFDTDVAVNTAGTYWTTGTVADCGWTIANGVANQDGSTDSAADNFLRTTSNVLLANTTYKVVIDVSSEESGGILSLNDINATFASNVEAGTTTIYHTTDGSDRPLGIDADSGTALTVNSISIKPVNAKNHATTVFYGDEMVVGDDKDMDTVGNWVAAGSATVTGGEASGDAADAPVLQIAAGTTSFGRAELPQSDLDETTIAGRTYLVTFNYKFTETTDMSHDAYINIGGTVKQNIVRTNTSWTAYSDTFIATDNSTNIKIYCQGDSGHANNELLIDDFSIKEEGTASGWTDADQQLDIPQTALQSYNQLAWWKDYTASGSYTANEYVTIKNDITTYRAESLSFWFITDSTKEAVLVAGLLNCGGYGNVTISDVGDIGKITVAGAGGDDCFCQTTTTWNDGKWHHCVVVVEGDGTSTDDITSTGEANAIFSIYMDGEEQTLEVGGGYRTSSDTLIGCRKSTVYQYQLEGSITEVSAWSNELTQAEVNELYNDGKALNAKDHSQYTNCLGYWRNNGLSAWTNIKAPGTNNGALTGLTETMLITAGVDGSRDSQGFLMNSQRTTNSLNLPYFTASDGYIMSSEVEVKDLGDNFDFGTGHISISAWIKKRLSGKAGYIVTCQNTGYQNMGFHIRITANNDLAFVVGDGSNFYEINHNTDLDDGEWHNVVGVYTATTGGTTQGAAIYINGIYKGRDHESSAGSGGSDVELGAINTSSGVRIGGKSWSNIDSNATQMYDGQIDDVLIYKGKALDDGLTSRSIGDVAKGEIARNYNAGKRSHK